MLFWLFSQPLPDEVLVLHGPRGASAFLDHFFVLFLSAFRGLPGFIGEFFLGLLAAVGVAGFVDFLNVLDRKALNFFGGVVLKLYISVGISG